MELFLEMQLNLASRLQSVLMTNQYGYIFM